VQALIPSTDSWLVIGARVQLGSDNTPMAGVRIFQGVRLPDGAIRF
jgi:hypothetical protein